MFKINNDMSIHISLGDSADFPLFLNRGSVIAPIRYGLTSTDNNEIYFYIFNINDVTSTCPVLLKTYQTNGTVTGYRDGIQIYQKTNQTVINENGDLILSFYPEDTADLYPTQYKYQVKAKLDMGTSGVKEFTVTNKNDLFIINDDFSGRTWE